MPAPQATLTQLLFASSARFNFAHVVADLQGLLIDQGHGAAQVIWDCDDVVSLDCETVRVVVGWGDALYPLAAQHLTFALAVVPRQTSRPRNGAALQQRLAEALSAWMTRRYRPDQVTRAQGDIWPGAALLEVTAHQMMVSVLTATATGPAHPFHAVVSDAQVAEFIGRMPDFPNQPSSAQPARAGVAIRPHPPGFRPPRVQDTLPGETTLALRMATQVLNLTLAVVWLPLGVALLAHSVLRGGTLRLSAQAMALAGLFSAGLDFHGAPGWHAALHLDPYSRASSNAATASAGNDDRGTT